MISIAEEIRNDREKGAKRLESEYKEGLLVFARRICPNESDAEALVYRTFEEVIEGIDGYTEKSAFFGWMCKILVNCHAKDVRRKSNRTITVTGNLPDVADEYSAERVFASVDSSILRDAITRLPKEMKDAVILHYFMEMSLKEIAAFLAVPIGTVMSRLHYARLALKQRLAAQLKKPAVALIAALLLFGATAAVVGLRGTDAANHAAGESNRSTANQAAGESGWRTMNQDAAAGNSSVPDAPATGQSVRQVLPISQSTQEGGQEMTGRKAAAAALAAAALAASAPCEAIDPPYGAASSCATACIELDARAFTCRATAYTALYTVPFKGMMLIIF